MLVCRGVLVLIPDQPSRLLGLEFILTAGTFGVALLLLASIWNLGPRLLRFRSGSAERRTAA